VLQVDAGPSAVIFAGPVDSRRVFETAQVLVERLLSNRARPGSRPVEPRPQEILCAVADQRLRERRGLDQEEPVPILGRELLGHDRVRQRDDVEHRRLGHDVGMLDRQPPRDPRPAIVPRHSEALEAERPHHVDLILGHRTLRVVRVIVAVRRLAAVAVTAQIGHYDRELPRQPARDLVPLGVRLRIPVDQQQRWPTAPA
jgi:hypothetical protein